MKKISRHFTTTTTGILACLAAILIATSAQANTVSFYDTHTVGGTYLDFLLGKFDTGLGALTAVEIKVDFSTLAGSVTVTSSSASPVTVSDVFATFKMRQSSTNTLGFTTTYTNFLGVATTPDWNSTGVAGNSSQVYAIVGGQSYTISPQTISSGFFTAYESVGGVGSVVMQGLSAPTISATGGQYSVDPTAAVASTKMTVTYTYTAVPEPGTIGLLAVAGGVILVAVRRRRA